MFAHADQENVAAYLLYLYGYHSTYRKGNTARAAPAKTKLFDAAESTPRGVSRSDAFPSLPPEILQSIFSYKKVDVQKLQAYITISSNPQPLVEAVRTREIDLTSKLFHLKKKARLFLRNTSRHLDMVGRIQTVSKLIDTIRRARQILDPGFSRSDSVFSNSSTHSPQSVDAQRRPPNRFTGVSYTTLQEEIKAVQQWRAAQTRITNLFQQQYIVALRQKGRESSLSLKRKLETALLKQQISMSYLKALYDEASSNLISGNQAKEESLLDDATSFANKLIPLEPLYAPYNVHHYVLGNIVDQFKEAMYKFGRREFPVIMESRGWTSAESVPVAEFMLVLRRRADTHIRDRYNFFEKEFTSLRLVRNAHAHSSDSMTIQDTRTSLADMRIAAEALRFPEMVPKINQYLKLLESFEHDYNKKKEESQERALPILRGLHENRESAIKKLEPRIYGTQEQERILESQKNAIREFFYHKISSFLRQYKTIDRHTAAESAQELAAFALEEHIRRSLRAMSGPAAKSLVQRLFAEHTASETVTADASVIDPVQISEASSAMPGASSSETSNNNPAIATPPSGNDEDQGIGQELSTHMSSTQLDELELDRNEVTSIWYPPSRATRTQGKPTSSRASSTRPPKGYKKVDPAPFVPRTTSKPPWTSERHTAHSAKIKARKEKLRRRERHDTSAPPSSTSETHPPTSSTKLTAQKKERSRHRERHDDASSPPRPFKAPRGPRPSEEQLEGFIKHWNDTEAARLDREMTNWPAKRVVFPQENSKEERVGKREWVGDGGGVGRGIQSGSFFC
ncbi:hypothetical protein N0V83_003772 [Neocucurbitaria cava]|uniref:Uncharacterized protein n=1 Tax=Neocucurbitaria cava TaxID=798079 RepID=A0A9W8YBK6_9PLEO|nr:hypothetical protein N0V83_003772 [Neocucurbitaria cava]